MSAPGVRVLELVHEHRRKADELARYNPTTAETMRALAEEYEQAVRESMPEWWTLQAVQQAKPWSMKWLRARCQDLRGVGRARKGENHHWLMRWDAVLDLPNPPKRGTEEIDPDDDLDALIEDLARSA